MATSSFDEMLVIETPEQLDRFMNAVKEAEERKVPLVDTSEDIFETMKKNIEILRERWSVGTNDRQS